MTQALRKWTSKLVEVRNFAIAFGMLLSAIIGGLIVADTQIERVTKAPDRLDGVEVRLDEIFRLTKSVEDKTSLNRQELIEIRRHIQQESTSIRVMENEIRRLEALVGRLESNSAE